MKAVATTFAATAGITIAPHANEQAAPYSPFEPGRLTRRISRHPALRLHPNWVPT
jgi:hypothetical protein